MYVVNNFSVSKMFCLIYDYSEITASFFKFQRESEDMIFNLLLNSQLK